MFQIENELNNVITNLFRNFRITILEYVKSIKLRAGRGEFLNKPKSQNQFTFSIFLAVIFLCVSSFAQQINIKIINAPDKAVLSELEGEKTNEIDSLFSVNDTFTFSLKDKHPGLYRLLFDHMHFINFINDGEDVELITDFSSITDSLKVIKSKSKSPLRKVKYCINPTF